jgi:hypothetical protein
VPISGSQGGERAYWGRPGRTGVRPVALNALRALGRARHPEPFERDRTVATQCGNARGPHCEKRRQSGSGADRGPDVDRRTRLALRDIALAILEEGLVARVRPQDDSPARSIGRQRVAPILEERTLLSGAKWASVSEDAVR